MTTPFRRFLIRLIFCLAIAAGAELHADPIVFKSAEATFHSRDTAELERVIDGSPIGPEGWSVAPQIDKPQSMIFRCARPVEAADLDVTLFFLSGSPNLSIAEFSLSYTTDAEPTLGGNWKPLEIQRFTAEVATLQRTEQGHLRVTSLENLMTGSIPDDTYRVAVLCPEGRATGFRLDVFPVCLGPGSTLGMSWGNVHDFVLTEFRVEEHLRESTNIALHCPVKASHPLFLGMQPGALTDGLPATIAHPVDEIPNPDFYYEVDLGRIAAFDHLALRTRGDGWLDRFSRIIVRLYEADPAAGTAPSWEGMIRADGSYPPAGTADIVRAAQGKGVFRGRYLRISSLSNVHLSPQLAEVEVYESRAPEVVEARADGREVPIHGRLDLPPGARRLSLRLRIPQIGLPPGESFRWRLRGDLDDWQTSRLMTIDMPCPTPGKNTVFEAQALHSDHQWDATVFTLPITTRQYFWENRWFQGGLATAILIFSMRLERTWARRRSARQLAEMKSRAMLAEERTRIARDLHDEIGANLTHISILSTLAAKPATGQAISRQHNLEVAECARETIQSFDEILWSINPKNDTLQSLSHYICRRAEEMLAPTGISHRFELDETLPDFPLPPQTRHSLLLAVKESLHNIIKHADAKAVEIKCGMENDRLYFIRISDDGRGFDPNAIPTSPNSREGMGLMSLQRRLAEIHGECHIQSLHSHGTQVTFRLPL